MGFNQEDGVPMNYALYVKIGLVIAIAVDYSLANLLSVLGEKKSAVLNYLSTICLLIGYYVAFGGL